jgi:hypothetical protein
MYILVYILFVKNILIYIICSNFDKISSNLYLGLISLEFVNKINIRLYCF